MNNRSRRVAEQLRQELATLLLREVKDPRVTRVSITAIDVTTDLEHAKVWFTVYEGAPEAAREGLQRASGFLRSELAKRMKLRTVPKLTFQYDASVARGAHLSKLIDDAVKEDQSHHLDDQADQTPD